MKISIHPLFLLAGILSAVFGGFTVFIICVLTALLHECGHIFCAERLGYECTKVSLMPYGASAVCDIEDISAADEVRLALAGPAVNLFLAVALAGLWWFFPLTYAYTDVLFYANAAMLLLNLLPAYPLDGGRVLSCALKRLFSQKAANITTRAVNFMVIAAIIIIFFTAYHNYTLLSAAVFLLFSALQKSPPARRINFSARKKKNGREARYIVLNKSATYRDALKYLDGDRFLVFQIYDKKFLDELTEDELFEKLQSHSLYDKICEDQR